MPLLPKKGSATKQPSDDKIPKLFSEDQTCVNLRENIADLVEPLVEMKGGPLVSTMKALMDTYEKKCIATGSPSFKDLSERDFQKYQNYQEKCLQVPFGSMIPNCMMLAASKSIWMAVEPLRQKILEESSGDIDIDMPMMGKTDESEDKELPKGIYDPSLYS